MVLAEFIEFKHGLYKSCGIECFEGIMLEPCLLQPCFHVAGLRHLVRDVGPHQPVVAAGELQPLDQSLRLLHWRCRILRSFLLCQK